MGDVDEANYAPLSEALVFENIKRLVRRLVENFAFPPHRAEARLAGNGTKVIGG